MRKHHSSFFPLGMGVVMGMSISEKIYIVDDDAAVRDSLRMLLKADGHEVETYASAEEFLAAYQQGMRGCIILDIKMPGMDGPALQAELNRRGMRLPLIFLSGQGTIPVTVSTIKAGAVDFLTKPVDGTELLASVRAALKQDNFQLGQDTGRYAVSPRLSALTAREREIMLLTIEGQTSKEIARQLSISYRTVESHRAHILRKTGASNLIELARIASQYESP
ncbi:MAG TPA: response regulator [Gallionellaceae bacterium]